jgi:hypothetical protein
VVGVAVVDGHGVVDDLRDPRINRCRRMVVEIYLAGGRSGHHGIGQFRRVHWHAPCSPDRGPPPAAISKGVARLFLVRTIGPPTRAAAMRNAYRAGCSPDFLYNFSNGVALGRRVVDVPAGSI